MKDILRRLQDALIESTKPSRDCTEAGGFMIMLTPDDPLVWINYAVPVAEANNVDKMITVFQQANRTPLLEFFLDLWPETVSALEQKGFVCEKRMPIMVLKRQEWKGLPHAHDIRIVDETTFHQVNQMLAGAFGMEPSEQKTEDPLDDPTFQRIANGTTLTSVAIVDGQVVGAGFGIGTPTIREIAGIGTKASHRKQGIASAVIAHLLDQFFGAEGEIAWLTPGDDTAQSVYANLGFRTVAEQVIYELREVPKASDAL